MKQLMLIHYYKKYETSNLMKCDINYVFITHLDTLFAIPMLKFSNFDFQIIGRLWL